jgi:hypothetical protein
MSDYEKRVIEYEAALNETMDKWFNARIAYERTGDAEFIWESGFRMAWEQSRERIALLEAVAEAVNPILKRYEWFIFNPSQQKEMETVRDALRAAGYLGESE